TLVSLKTMTLRGTAGKILGDLEIEGKKKLLDEALYTAGNGPEKEAQDEAQDEAQESAEAHSEDRKNPEAQAQVEHKKKTKTVGLWPWVREVEVDED
ncbi:unnamed protein product, partial [marine sediment metagenome]